MRFNIDYKINFLNQRQKNMENYIDIGFLSRSRFKPAENLGKAAGVAGAYFECVLRILKTISIIYCNTPLLQNRYIIVDGLLG